MATEEPKTSNSGRWQFSLRALLVVVTTFGLASFALTNANSDWVMAGTIQCVAMWAALTILFGFSLPSGRRRWFWIGCGLSTPIFFFLYGGLYYVAGLMMIYSGVYSHIPFSLVRAFISFLFIAAVPSSFLGGLLARYFYSTRVDES